MDKGKAALTGAASGAAAGAVLGPWGAAAGGVIGGVAGWFGAGDDAAAPQYTPDHQNFQYGLGPSDSYASLQSEKYDSRQAQLAALGADAYNREAQQQALPDRRDFVQSGGQSYLANAGQSARAQQLQALGGYENANSAIQQFANRSQGPSAAQAQLQAGTDAAARQQFGFARAQPGGGGAALRQAAFNAGGISANSANQAAMLRAQEDQAFRAQQLQALGAVQQGAAGYAGQVGQLRGQDIGLAGAQAGQANYGANAQNAYNAQQQQLQFGVGQNNLNAQITNRAQGDAMALQTGAQSMGYDAMRNQLASNQLGANVAFEQAKAQGAGLGSANFNAQQQQGNAETAMMLGAASGATGYIGQLQASNKNGWGDGSGNPTSDIRAKTDIKPASVLEALGGGGDRAYTRGLYEQQTGPQAHLRSELADVRDVRARGHVDGSLSEFGGIPSRVGLGPAGTERQARLAQLAALGSPDLRGAQGYEYAYKDPERHGEGRYVGPMAQDLEHLPGVVEQGSDGTKSINAPRLTLANTAAVSEQQRRMDELEAEQRRLKLQALGVYTPAGPVVR